jgi:tRNA (guanine37-N1)-methyltransferase
MQLDVVSLFPEWFEWFREQRHVRNAFEAGHELRVLDPRPHSPLSGGQVDDTPFGGGAGMVLRVDVMDAALRAFYGVDPVELRTQRRVIALTPGGRMLDDRLVDELAAEPALTLLCGRYEGFDERIVQHFASDAVSIGRYVLSGGELAAMVVCDAVLRKLPGALGHADSAVEESFSEALGGDPEYPHYTRRDPQLAARAQPRARRGGRRAFATMSRRTGAVFRLAPAPALRP